MTRGTFFAAVLLLVQFCSSSESADQVPDAQSGSVGRWEQSFKARSVDASGRLVGGTEIIHPVSHKGRLYAGNGYWMDTVPKAQIPWAQVLVLDSPEGSWKVDLALGPRHLRVTMLKSVTFKTDGNGAALDAPVSLLLAGFDHHEVGKAPVYRETNIWTPPDVIHRGERQHLRLGWNLGLSPFGRTFSTMGEDLLRRYARALGAWRNTRFDRRTVSDQCR